jgi:hypothetical protein
MNNHTLPHRPVLHCKTNVRFKLNTEIKHFGVKLNACDIDIPFHSTEVARSLYICLFINSFILFSYFLKTFLSPYSYVPREEKNICTRKRRSHRRMEKSIREVPLFVHVINYEGEMGSLCSTHWETSKKEITWETCT